MDDYRQFIESKRVGREQVGFDPVWKPDFLFDFQHLLTDWSIGLGRSAIFADCGMGKTPMQLVWAENIVRRENCSGLILTPLTVSRQTIAEGKKFGIEVHDARSGTVRRGINVVNYERLHYFKPEDFGFVVCDESSILKNFDGSRRQQITEFVSSVRYRLLCSATPAPNDYVELGTSAEALGVMGRNQMLGMFFSHKGDTTQNWELKGHARKAYWRWVASWARAIRRPSDFGFDDGGFKLPPLNVEHYTVPGNFRSGDRGFFNYANTLEEQRQEKRLSLKQRCEKVAELVPLDRPVVIWTHLNDEADLLEKLIPDAVQVAGRHADEEKESRLDGFRSGSIRVMVTKPKIAGFGMNWQHCSDVFCFPSHSYESYYQMVRRCWRFGQVNPVTVRIILSEAERLVMKNMLWKEQQAIKMFEGIIREMRDYQVVKKISGNGKLGVEVPEWLSRSN